MKLKVIRSFKDKQTKELYEVGSNIELTDLVRINDVVSRGLCLILELETETQEPVKEQDEKKTITKKTFVKSDHLP